MTLEESWLRILPEGGFAGPRTRARMTRVLERMPHLGLVSDDVVMVALPILPELHEMYVAAIDEARLAACCARFLPGLLEVLGPGMTINLKADLTSPFEPYGFAPIEQIHYYTLERLSPCSPDPRVRMARVSDIETMLEIDSASFPLPYRRGPDEMLMHVRDASIVRVVVVDDQVAGFSIIQPLGPRFHLGAVGVSPSHQGLGLGRLLLDDAIHVALHAGATGIGLTTQTRNGRARSMYEKRGFEGQLHAEFWARAGLGVELHLY